MPMFGWSMGVDAWLFMAAWVLVIALLVWALVREPRRSSSDEAVAILRARMARGEINGEEYSRAIALLNSPPVHQEGSR